MRDSTSGNNIGNRAAPSSNTSNLKLKENSAIIPERRRKYLANASDDRGDINHFNQNASIDMELTDNQNNMHRKNNQLNVRLQPLNNQNSSSRNSSVPPMLGANPGLQHINNSQPHPLAFAPSPSQRGGHNVRLESIDHNKHQLTVGELEKKSSNGIP